MELMHSTLPACGPRAAERAVCAERQTAPVRVQGLPVACGTAPAWPAAEEQPQTCAAQTAATTPPPAAAVALAATRSLLQPRWQQLRGAAPVGNSTAARHKSQRKPYTCTTRRDTHAQPAAAASLGRAKASHPTADPCYIPPASAKTPTAPKWERNPPKPKTPSLPP